MYDPTVGRFLEEDPTEFQGKDLNFYRYADNSPTNFTDPSGTMEASQTQYTGKARSLLEHLGAKLPTAISPNLANRLKSLIDDVGLGSYDYSDDVKMAWVHGSGIFGDNANAAIMLVIDLERTDGKVDAAIYRLDASNSRRSMKRPKTGVK